MKFPLPPTTFPPVALAQEDEDGFKRVAEVVVKKTLAQYHEHLTQHRGVVDESRWKKIKQHDNVRVYREHSEHKDDGDRAKSDPNRVAPLTLTFGNTRHPRRRHSAYVEDGFVDWGVLVPIVKPTPELPFRELSVKWTVKGHPLLVGAVLRTRDTLYIESIGYAQTPNGERIGYHLQHSIEVPGIHELFEHNIVRARISFCHLFRQLPSNTVEVFVRGLIEPMGDTPASLATATSDEVSVSVWKNVHCAEMKKLTRIPRSKQRHHVTSSATSASQCMSSSGSSSTASQPKTVATVAATCALYSKSVAGRVASLTSSGKEKHCRICHHRVCARCRVYKDFFLRTELEKDLRRTIMAFCTRYIVIASKTSSVQFAEHDARERLGKSADEFEFDLGGDVFSAGCSRV